MNESYRLVSDRFIFSVPIDGFKKKSGYSRVIEVVNHRYFYILRDNMLSLMKQ